MESFISELLEISKECSLPFDVVFCIVYDYGLIDYLGNITSELFEYKKESL
ncbi:hypothetical protein [Chryseobacterium sp. G0201]|uniref:hypothetical protein n=1 Tax=Chryseobacterium sp. G0201 TaxID=2487065 RepID=UPI0013DE3E0E|nr:hypothetical protein [Chryseobacterium sp. G0201]